MRRLKQKRRGWQNARRKWKVPCVSRFNAFFLWLMRGSLTCFLKGQSFFDQPESASNYVLFLRRGHSQACRRHCLFSSPLEHVECEGWGAWPLASLAHHTLNACFEAKDRGLWTLLRGRDAMNHRKEPLSACGLTRGFTISTRWLSHRKRVSEGRY